MRSSFFRSLEELARTNRDVYFLTADLGFRLFDNIQLSCPGRFYDVGVAEANMTGISAGLSLNNKNVYCYSIIPFLVMRAYEQIRIDVAYHNLNVKFIGVGGGFTYGFEGLTHFGLEDLALMRSLPNMSVVVPADPVEARCLAYASLEHAGPLYIRLGRTGEPSVYDSPPDFRIGKAVVLREGKGTAIFASGSMVLTGIKVLKGLAEKGICPTLVNMHTLKPLDIDVIKQAAATHDRIFTLEEHNIDGGLGSAVAEVLSENGYAGIFRRIGIDYKTGDRAGNNDYLKEKYGLTPEAVLSKIMMIIKGE